MRTQQTTSPGFVRVRDSAHQRLQDGARFGAWLRQVVKSHALNFLRHERVRKSEPLLEATAASPGEMPDQAVVRAETATMLLTALGVLSEERREVVLLHDLEGWTHAEIAVRMDLPSGTVRSHLHHARRALRVEIGNSEEITRMDNNE